MISWDIDTNDLSEEFNLGRADIDQLLELSVTMVTKKFAEHWDTVAKNELGSTRQRYRSSIEIGSRGRFTGVVYLNPADKLSNMVEMGASTFDMKTGMLASSKVKHGVNGDPYITIPFRFATPSALGESEGFAGKMPADIFNAVKKDPETPLPLSKIGEKHRMPKSQQLRERMSTIKSKVGKLPMSAQTSKYEGLKRNDKGSGYVNFRRVSLRSDSRAFIHPGFSPKNLAEKAEGMLDIGHIVDIAIDNFLSSL